MITVLHFFDLPGPNPWIEGMAMRHDPAALKLEIATIGPRTSGHDRLETLGIETFAFDSTPTRVAPVAGARLAALLRRRRPDVLVTHFFWPSLVAIPAAKATRTPVILYRHYSDLTTVLDKPIHRTVDRIESRAADLVMAPSAGIKRAMVDIEGAAPDKIVVTPIAHDFDEIRPQLTVSARAELRNQLGGDDDFLIVTVGRLNPEKGHTFLVQAIPEVLSVVPSARFLFVGAGPLEAELRAEAERLGVSPRLTFLGYRNDAKAVMEAADLVVQPTLSEGLSSTIIEAMAVETPVVASDVAGVDEQIDDGETGVVVPKADPMALAEAIIRVATEREWAASLGAEARRRISARFSWDVVLPTYEAAYARVAR